MSAEVNEVSSRVGGGEAHSLLKTPQHAVRDTNPKALEEQVEHGDVSEKQLGKPHLHQHRKDAAAELLGGQRVEMTDEQVSQRKPSVLNHRS